MHLGCTEVANLYDFREVTKVGNGRVQDHLPWCQLGEVSIAGSACRSRHSLF